LLPPPSVTVLSKVTSIKMFENSGA
jgi:hypothetical protein